MPPVGKIETPERSRVRVVRIVVHKTGAFENGRSINHWVAYLSTEEGYVVKINMREKNGSEWPHRLFRDATYGEPGKLDISSYDSNLITDSMLKMWELSCIGRPRVRDFINTLLRNNRNHYNMAVGGSGCRWWVYNAIHGFESEGYFIPGTTGYIHERLMQHYTRFPDGTISREAVTTMPRGKFWDPQEWADEFSRYDPFAPSSDVWL